MPEPITTLPGKTFGLNLGEDRDPVYLGDRSTSALWRPRAELTRWNAEECLSLTLEGFAAGDPTLSNNTLALKHGDQEVKLYAPTPDDLEWEIVLHSKPAVSEWTFLLSGHEGLEFLYQPAMPQRPANVIGSYAVYAKAPKVNVAGGPHYRTGKLFHLYRPLATDAIGAKVWGDWSLAGDRLTLSLDPLWLQTATYPVTIDPDLGYTSAGGTWYNGGDRFWMIVYGTQAGSDGTAQKLWIYTFTSNKKVKVGLYDGIGGGNRLSHGELPQPNATNQWNSFDISGDAVGVSNGNHYYTACMYEDKGHGCKYDSADPDDMRYTTSPTAYASQMVDPSEDNTDWNNRCSIYMEYSEAGGVTADGAQTLPALVQVGALAVDVAVTAAQTLSALVQTGTLAVDVAGTAAQTLSALTQVASLTVGEAITLDGAQTLPGLTQSGALSVDVAATGSQALPSLTQSASLTTETEVVGAQALPSLTQSASLSVDVSAAGVQGLPSLTQAATLSVDVAGTGAQTLPSLVQSAALAVDIVGVGAQTLPALAQTASVTVGEGVSLNGAQTLPGLVQSASGSVAIVAAGVQTLPALTQAATTSVGVAASAAQTLPSLSQTGSLAVSVTGTGAQTLPSLTQAGAGRVAIVIAAAQTLLSLVQSADVVTAAVVGPWRVAAIQAATSGAIIAEAAASGAQVAQAGTSGAIIAEGVDHG